MRILHISDTHGNFPKLRGKFDVVVHSGDFCPDCVRYSDPLNDLSRKTALQLDWLSENIPLIRKWLNGIPLLYIMGNHDWIHPEIVEQTLNSENIKAISLQNKIVNYEGVTFYGFPYIPAINGMFNYEKIIPEMEKEVDRMVSILNKTYVDVLVAHSAIYKVLDLTFSNTNIGSSVISNAIDYKLKSNMIPNYFCHGHIHESAGITLYNDMLVSNAATTAHIIEII